MSSMSSAVIHVSVPAPRAPFCQNGSLPSAPSRGRLLQLPRGVVPGSQLEIRPAAATVPCGIPQLDTLTGGLPRGALTEIFGSASSGRTSLLLSALAEATRRQEVCALVDAADSFHPHSAAATAMDLPRLLWIRCGSDLRELPRRYEDKEKIADLRTDDCRLKNQARLSSHQRATTNGRPTWDKRLEQVLKTTDLLLQSGGFGMVVVDLADVPPRFARRIPLASWFRFRRAVENTPTVLLVIEQEPYAKTCASLVLKMQRPAPAAPDFGHQAVSSGLENAGHGHERLRFRFVRPVPWPAFDSHDVAASSSMRLEALGDNCPSHAHLLRALPVRAEIVHARLQRKPARSAAEFDARTAWLDSAAG